MYAGGYLMLNTSFRFSEAEGKRRYLAQCPVEAVGVCGAEVSCGDIIACLQKDREYFEGSSGGVTFSGGEPLLYDLAACLKEIRAGGFHIAVETSLHVPLEFVRRNGPYIDLFIVDVKILESELCRQILGVRNPQQYFNNVQYVLASGKESVFRFPVVEPYTLNERNIEALIVFIRRYGIKTLEIFSVHNLAREKYLSLGLGFTAFDAVSAERLASLKRRIEEKTGITVRLLEI
jgi:pyruvate formate lyase activating enzyme